MYYVCLFLFSFCSGQDSPSYNHLCVGDAINWEQVDKHLKIFKLLSYDLYEKGQFYNLSIELRRFKTIALAISLGLPIAQEKS